MLSRARGATHLLFDAVDAVTGVVEESHRSVWDRTVRRLAWLSPLDSPVRAVRDWTAPPTRAVYASIRLGSRATRTLVDLAVTRSERRREETRRPLISPSASPESGAGAPDGFDRAQSIVNGVWGCHLSRSAHLLDLGLSLRDPWGKIIALEGPALAEAFPKPTEKVVLFLHGSSSTEACWTFRAAHHYGDPRATFGRMLSDELGYTPLFIRYNSGRRIEQNGRELSRMLAALFERLPAEIDRIVLVGHSMGGLVARSAARHARDEGSTWVERLTDVVCLGTPLLGAPLARGAGHLSHLLGRIDAEGARVVSVLLDARSRGLDDLRWGEDRAARPVGDPTVRHHFIGSTVTGRADGMVGSFIGDLLVPPASATGRKPAPEDSVPFHSQTVLEGLHHLDLVSHPRVYAELRSALGASSVPLGPPGEASR